MILLYTSVVYGERDVTEKESAGEADAADGANACAIYK